MILVVGLGNPTEKYKNNRHNIGFMVIDHLIDDLKPVNITKNSFKGELYKSGSLLLLKPTTYMNLSGESVASVVNYYKVDDVIVIHDDLDLVFGSIRFKNGGSSGGHNGLKSIDKHIGADYDRIRLGIGKPENKMDVVKFVLNDFSKDAQHCVKMLIERAAEAAIALSKSDLKDVVGRYTSKKSICI